jgi:predicted DCC family thiol-disulfide oxidoreductase YuxK
VSAPSTMVGFTMPVSTPAPLPPAPMLLFDGECGLCNRVVRLLLRLDRHARLRFAPLQGPSAQAYLRGQGLPTEDFDSLVFIPDWNDQARSGYLLRTDGVLAACRAVGGVGRVLAWTAVLPRGWRDAAYRFIARWRYRLFGTWVPTPLARPEWAERFLN